MAQYINREKLLKRMEGYCEANCGCKPYEDSLCPSCGLGDAIYMVEEQRIVNSRNMRGRKDATVALSKTEKTTHWIPVTERLPENAGVYLCRIKSFDGKFRYTDTMKYVDGFFYERGIATERITHWMPLPEPPKEEQI